MDKVLLNFAIMFCLKQLAKFGSETDWDMVKADYDDRVRKLVPGDWFDDQAVELTNDTIDAFAFICKDTVDVQKLINCVIAADWPGALYVLKDLVSKGYEPQTPKQVELKAAILAA